MNCNCNFCVKAVRWRDCRRSAMATEWPRPTITWRLAQSWFGQHFAVPRKLAGWDTLVAAPAAATPLWIRRQCVHFISPWQQHDDGAVPLGSSIGEWWRQWPCPTQHDPTLDGTEFRLHQQQYEAVGGDCRFTVAAALLGAATQRERATGLAPRALC
jgi:hypothetical protein